MKIPRCGGKGAVMQEITNKPNPSTKCLQPEYRPYEKFMAYGPEALSDAELLAVIIRTGSREENSIDLARRVLTPQGEYDASILNIYCR